MSTCAICVSTRGPFTSQPLGRDNAPVLVCFACDQPVFARTGPDRGWQPSGGLVDRDAMTAAARRVMGDGEYERQCKLESDFGKEPSARRSQESADLAAMDSESARRVYVKRNTWAPNGRRAK